MLHTASILKIINIELFLKN